MDLPRKTRVPHEAGAPLLQVEDVTVAYVPATTNGSTTMLRAGEQKSEERYALHDVSFEIGGGQRVAVIGPNGAGKSTLFKVIAGTLRPSQGTIHIFGHGAEEHICVAYVPQRNQIDWSFPVTVEDVVMMGRVGQIGLFRHPRRRDWEIVRHSLERVNGRHLADKQIGELSGGQQQRVFIARALAQQAELLLLDEPFTGLDIPSHEAIFNILDMLDREGVTVMVATHDLNLAAEQFEQVMLLNKEVVAFGPPPTVLTTENLVTAYGGQMHVLGGSEGNVVLADTCCAGEEEMATKG